MKKLSIVCLLGLSFTAYAQQDSTDALLLDYLYMVDSVNQSFTFEQGTVVLGDDLATLVVPEGFKYLNPRQSNYVLTELWGNPPAEDGLGMLFPEDIFPMSIGFTYAVEITYSEEGHIEDDDAEDIDYDDLLEEIQKSMKEESKLRMQQGYQTIEMVGWAETPFYDNKAKKLHWAKELKFGQDSINTLNYNIRVLGRKGFLNLNAIGNMEVLSDFNKSKDRIISSVEFKDGYRYADFNPDLDKVAAYGIGGLIAGKVLAKAGFFAILLKFWKIIAFGAIGLFSAFRKRIYGIFKGE